MNFYKKKKNNFLDKLYNILLVILFLVLAGIVYANYIGSYVKSTDATTEGKFITLQSRIDGMIAQVYVEKDLEVKKGDLLMEIDSTVYRQELRRKEAELNKLKTKLYFKEHKYEEKENPTIISDDNQRMEEKEEIFPKSTYSTYSKMYDKDIIHLQNRYKKIKIEEDTKTDNETAQEENEDDKLTINDILKLIKETEIQISDIKLAISYSKIYASQDGIITDISVSDGDYVEVGQALLSIIPKMVWITANFSSNDFNNIAIGQSVKISINGYKRKNFKGIIEYLPQEPSNEFGNKSARIVFAEDYTDYNIEPGKFATCYVKVK